MSVMTQQSVESSPINFDDEIRALISESSSVDPSTVITDESLYQRDETDEQMRGMYLQYDKSLLDTFNQPAIKNGSKKLASDRHFTRTTVQQCKNELVHNSGTAVGHTNTSNTIDVGQMHADQLIAVDSIELSDINVYETRHISTHHTIDAGIDADYRYELSGIQHRSQQVNKNINIKHDDITSQLQHRISAVHGISPSTIVAQQTAVINVSTRLLAILEQQRSAVQQQFGELQPSKPLLPDGSQIRHRHRNHTPRLLTIRVDAIRAVKNKLLGGLYVMCVTLYDRLGGTPMRWCKLPMSEKSASKKQISHTSVTDIPYRHGGKYWNLEMRFDQNSNALYVCCPAKNETRTSHVLVFELFRHSHGVDSVVAWGTFPLCTPSHELISGKFKVAMLRGQCTPFVDRHTSIDDAVKSSVDNWLANMYFRANPITVRGDRVFNYRTMSYQWKLHYSLTTNAFLTAANATTYLQRQAIAATKQGIPTDAVKAATAAAVSTRRAALLNDGRSLSNALSGAAGGGGKHRSSALMNQLQEQAVMKDKDETAKKIAAIERAKQLRQYQTAVTAHNTDSTTSRKSYKYSFLYTEILSDLGLNRWTQFESWAGILLLALCFWIRIYIHYLGQYYWLTQNSLPILAYTVATYSIHIEYTTAVVHAAQVAAEMLAIGTVSNIIVFAVLVGISFTVQMVMGVRVLADAWFRLVLSYGAMVCADPIMIVLVDLCSVNLTNGDYCRLYHISGYVGAVMSVVLGLCLMALSTAIFYIYVVHVHMNGRLLDLYARLHTDTLNPRYIPNDTEISYNTLKHIIQRAKNFKGLFGTRRKILLAKYTLTDQSDPTYQQTMLHISIYNVTAPDAARHKPEMREIYRHFVRLNDGAICEEFDVMLTGANVGDTVGSQYVQIETKWLDESSHDEEVEFLQGGQRKNDVDDNDDHIDQPGTPAELPQSIQPQPPSNYAGLLKRKLSGIAPINKPAHQSTNRISAMSKVNDSRTRRFKPVTNTSAAGRSTTGANGGGADSLLAIRESSHDTETDAQYIDEIDDETNIAA